MNRLLEKIILIVCTIAIVFCGWQIYYQYSLINDSNEKINNLLTPIQAETQTITSPVVYEEMVKRNSDYRGWIWFDSNLISLPVVQSDDNFQYLNCNLDKEPSLGGIPCIDAADTMSDQNITIYGHSVFGDHDALVFTPLQQLLNQDTYSKNKRFYIAWEDGIKTYEIYAVCDIDKAVDDWNYTQNIFQTDTDFYDFIHHALDRSKIHSDVDIVATDQLITLQTCTELESTKRTVILAKEV